MALSRKAIPETASQTAGPYVHIGCKPSVAGLAGIYPEDLGLRAIEKGAKGQVITIRGLIIDGTGQALRDALVETWQADAKGRYPGQPGADLCANGFCRLATDIDSGEFTLTTVKPGPVPGPGGRMQAPHISVWIVARGINTGLQTRIYFDDEDNSQDPLLGQIKHRDRANTLVAKRTGLGQFRFDIHLQGAGETVFLDI